MLNELKNDFVSRCLRGEALLEDIDDFVSAWHEGDSEVPLHEFLGMTHEEYSYWIVDANVLPNIILARKKHIDFLSLVNENALSFSIRTTLKNKNLV